MFLLTFLSAIFQHIVILFKLVFKYYNYSSVYRVRQNVGLTSLQQLIREVAIREIAIIELPSAVFAD